MVNKDDKEKLGGDDLNSSTEEILPHEKGVGLKVLGTGCANCRILAKNTVSALEQLGMEPRVDKITDFGEIASYGVISMPALVIGRKVVSAGKVLSAEEIIKIIDKQRGQVRQ